MTRPGIHLGEGPDDFLEPDALVGEFAQLRLVDRGVERDVRAGEVEFALQEHSGGDHYR